MILTIDKSTSKIKLAILQRDMLVYIPGVRIDPQKNQCRQFSGRSDAGGPCGGQWTFRLDIKEDTWLSTCRA